MNLLLYHGVLASHARARPDATALVVPLDPTPSPACAVAVPVVAEQITPPPATTACPTTTTPRAAPTPPRDPEDAPAAEGAVARRHDVLACTVCGGRLRFIATIEDPPVVQRILSHVGLPTTVPDTSPARPPPAAGDTLAFDFPG